MISTTMDVEIDEKIKQKIVEPDLYKVIFLNDNSTPMEFVIDVLIQIFKHSDTTARDLTVKIHEDGSAVVGVFSFEIAEQIAKGDARMIQGIKKLMIENTGESIRNQFTKEMRAVDSWLKPITVQESFKTFLDKKGRKNG